MRSTLLLLAILAATPTGDRRAEEYSSAIRQINEKHAAKPGKVREDELAKQVPASARKALEDLLAPPRKNFDEGERIEALKIAGEAALDLDLEEDFERVRAELAKLSESTANDLGVLVSRDRFAVIGTGGIGRDYLTRFADIFQAVLVGYEEVFGFAELSKVPGKKLRVRVRLVPAIKEPPHFAPQFPYHSEIDFPVADKERFASPTGDGKFLFYGLCHELGHVVAMWGDRNDEEDRHAWAHYTGVTVVEHLAGDKRWSKLLDGVDDARWRSLEKEREAAKGVEPGLGARENVLAMLIALHDEIGPKAIGAAINALDAADERLRVNKVRYYRFADLEKELVRAAPAAKREKLAELIP
jgi:hypothetical protein